MNKSEFETLKKMKVCVLMGGTSSEREISLKSGQAVTEALRREGLAPDALDIDAQAQRDLPGKLKEKGAEIVFVALHGPWGEDGTAQGILEEIGIPYTGSNKEASRLAMEKPAARNRFQKAGVPVAQGWVLKEGERVEKLDFPVVVKPAGEGSTIGVSVVRGPEELPEALATAFRYGESVLVEKYIAGREISVGILEEEPLPVIEIRAREGFYDYQAKYSEGLTNYLVPAKLPGALARQTQEIALAAHRSLGCYGMSRVDMRLGEGDIPYVLEINTIPGLAAMSLLPMAGRAAGIEFGELCLRVLASGLRRGRGGGPG